MLLQHRRTFASLIQAFDVAVLFSAGALATLWADRALPYWPVLLAEWVLGLLMWTGAAARVGLYESRRSTRMRGELWGLLQVVLIASGAMLLVRAWLAPANLFAVPAALALAVGAMSLTRIAIRLGLRSLRRKGMNTRTVLFIGRGKTARAIAVDLLAHRSYGLKILGNLHFTGEENIALPDGVQDLGDTTGLPEILKEHAIDEVHLCPSDAVWTTEVKSVLRFCETVGITCRVAPDFLGIPPGRTTVAWVGQTPTYTIYSGFHNSRMLAIKRVIDVVGTSIGLTILLPVIIGIAIAIKLTSKGPVFFRQTRVGLNGRLFSILKFRSMVPDAEQRKKELEALNEVSGPVFKIKKDPRITKVGGWLRKYSLDELPQLINVLKGDMSLVGPRPPIPSEVRQYDWWQRRRLSVRPGLTCIWQVSGRNAVDFDRWMELDLQYIDGWSLGMDIKIMAKTVTEVLRGGGA
jgi:exopolysaccharide biosynthesis polyprenyl glycosylphosphotransferase